MDYGTGVCPFCRKVFQRRSNVQIYCSLRCGEHGRRITSPCEHNDGVDCYGAKRCETCAWNPGSGVSQNRLAIYLAGGAE